MPLNYSVALRPNPQDKDATPKAYATAQINGELTLKQLSKRVSSQTTVSRADVVAVLTATGDHMLEALKEEIYLEHHSQSYYRSGNRYRQRHWIGYHFYITHDGEIHRGRAIEKIGAHCKNHNRHSVGICYEGGLSSDGIPTDTRTLEQKAAMLALLRELRSVLPRAIIVGHRDLDPLKACPCCNAVKEYGSL